MIFEHNNFHGEFHPWCNDCKRYYNPQFKHVCSPADRSIDGARKQLEEWLGEGIVKHEES